MMPTATEQPTLDAVITWLAESQNLDFVASDMVAKLEGPFTDQDGGTFYPRIEAIAVLLEKSIHLNGIASEALQGLQSKIAEVTQEEADLLQAYRASNPAFKTSILQTAKSCADRTGRRASYGKPRGHVDESMPSIPVVTLTPEIQRFAAAFDNMVDEDRAMILMFAESCAIARPRDELVPA